MSISNIWLIYILFPYHLADASIKAGALIPWSNLSAEKKNQNILLSLLLLEFPKQTFQGKGGKYNKFLYK